MRIFIVVFLVLTIRSFAFAQTNPYTGFKLPYLNFDSDTIRISQINKCLTRFKNKCTTSLDYGNTNHHNYDVLEPSPVMQESNNKKIISLLALIVPGVTDYKYDDFSITYVGNLDRPTLDNISSDIYRCYLTFNDVFIYNLIFVINIKNEHVSSIQELYSEANGIYNYELNSQFLNNLSPTYKTSYRIFVDGDVVYSDDILLSLDNSGKIQAKGIRTEYGYD